MGAQVHIIIHIQMHLTLLVATTCLTVKLMSRVTWNLAFT